MWRVELTTDTNITINDAIKVHVNALEADGHFDWYKGDRGATKPKKDAALGKKAEFLVAAWVESIHGVHLEPDLRILDNRNWTADLPYSGLGKSMPDIHVKACNASTEEFIGGMSWTFQNEDDLFGADDALIACVYMHGWSSNIGYLTAQTWATIRGELKEPKKPDLKGRKKCWTPDINRYNPKSLVGVKFELTNQPEDAMVPT